MASSCVTQVSASLVGIKSLSFPSSSRKSSSVKLCQIKSGMWGSSLNLKASFHSPLIRRQRKILVCEAEATSTSETDIEVEVLTSTQEEEEKKEENDGEKEIEGEVEVVQTLQPAKTGKAKKTKGLKNIMQTLHQRAVEAASEGRNIPDLRTGDIVQLRVEVPQNKKRISLLRGIVIAKHNAGIHTTFRIRRVIAGVGVEMVFPIYSPNIKEIKVVNSRKVRRAKLYYLRDKLARLSTV